MIFYKRMIGDIQAKTGHLTLAEFGAYDRLLDHYYSTERGIPEDRVYGIARAVSKEDRKAVDFVIAEFFTLGSDGLYRQGKTEEMIAEAQPKILAARTNGGKGGRPKKQKTETQQKPSGLLNENPNETQDLTKTGVNRKASQSQSENISKEVTLSNSDGSARDSENLSPTPKPEPARVVAVLAQNGIPDVSPSHPEVLALIAKGITPEVFEAAAKKSVNATNRFAYVLTVVKSTLQSAAEIQAGPAAGELAWDTNRQTIEAMGVRVGIGKWDEVATVNREPFAAYVIRVRQAMVEQEITA